MDQSGSNITGNNSLLSTNILKKLPSWLIEMTEYVFDKVYILFYVMKQSIYF